MRYHENPASKDTDTRETFFRNISARRSLLTLRSPFIAVYFTLPFSGAFQLVSVCPGHSASLSFNAVSRPSAQ
ncbi:hypothetical protein CCP2SC5_310026 [Azospirillaceae bacterium]